MQILKPIKFTFVLLTLFTLLGLTIKAAVPIKPVVDGEKTVIKVSSTKPVNPQINSGADFNAAGDRLAKQKRWLEAEKSYREALRLEPANHDYLYDYYGVMIEQGHWQQAALQIRKALQHHPNDMNFLGDLGWVLMKAGRHKEAEAALRKALKVRIRTSELVNLGTVLSRRNKKAEAERSLRAALNMDAKDTYALNGLGWFLVEENRNLDEAVNLLQQALNLSPDEGNLKDSLGYAYFKQGNLVEAEQLLLDAASLEPDNEEIHEHLGDLYLRQGKSQQARTAWRKALRLAKDAKVIASLKSKLRRIKDSSK